ncbi:MAG: bifunctional hydroxymethylpyrimidine kinase/phosphomethylpyrimidine kinase [Actinomycetes bacterium]
MEPPIALTIAGSDSGGCAGIQADLRSFAALGVHGCSAITAVTAQNTRGVDKVEILSPAMVVAQIDAVANDMRPKASKTGMLATPAIVEAVAERLARGDLGPLVVDPVIVATSGAQLLEGDAIAHYRAKLIPLASLLTPNLYEAAALLGLSIDEVKGEKSLMAADRLLELGCKAVLLKGGHADDKDLARDLLITHEGSEWLESPRIHTRNDHGTGCTLAAAITAFLALGYELRLAAIEAKAYLHEALIGAQSWNIGSGHGPVDHLGWNH